MAAATQALVLDFGGVISRTMFETHAQTEVALGLEPGTLNWRGPFAPDTDALWFAMQNEELSERDYWAKRTAEVAELVGADWKNMAEFVQAARGADPERIIRPEAITAIAQALQRGYSLAVLSNELDLFYGAGFREKLPVLKSFEVIVDATYTGILKPDPRAYQSVTDALGIEASDCVFVDDQPRNVLGAATAGMKTVLFDVQQPAASYLMALELLDKSFPGAS